MSDILPHGQIRFETSPEHDGAVSKITVEVNGKPVADLSWAVAGVTFTSPPRTLPIWTVDFAADPDDPTHLTLGGPR